ncbi:MAG: FAD-dependent oxidoreductase [Leptospiraceae bacterium]|nr:FAD-dependent oxidoreductase [Leptospiraceae bacterium]
MLETSRNGFTKRRAVRRCVKHAMGCTVSGQAAGVAAALAVQTQKRPRDLEIRQLQAALIKQGVRLH